MKFSISKYGIISACIYLIYFSFIFVVDPSEAGPLGFLQYVSFLFYIPVYLVSIFIPVQMSSWVTFILGLIIFYFIGAGIQKYLNKRGSVIIKI